MTDTTLAMPGLSRRGLLKVGLFGTAFLATAGVTATLSGCSASTPASGLAVL
ncbi:MAG: twin-arginine translocation pathway signal protein, partial [Pseudomonas sp.]